MVESTYQRLSGGAWFRGNLHAHTDRTDGKQPLQPVIDHYHKLGYDFLMISDHDLYTSARDYAQLDSHGMALIPGNEITRDGLHILHVNAGQLISPDVDRQRVIDVINTDGGFAILNHPTWWYADGEHGPFDMLRHLNGYVGVEVYNGVIGILDGNPEANYRWDNLLSEGRRVWGFANDDCHDVEYNENGLRQAGVGWNMVYCSEPTADKLVEAMRSGAFYASTGVAIDTIAVEGRTIRITTRNADRIVALRDVGRCYAATDGSEITVQFPEGAQYLRFECFGPRGSKAWTQPFFAADR